MLKKLAIVTTHPIQYYAPVFQLLAKRERIAVKVFYTGGKAGFNQFDKGFGKDIHWDIPLLDGYEHTFLHNTSSDPGTHHFKGIINPAIIEEINAYQPDAILVYGWAWSSHFKVMRHFYRQIPVWFRGDSTLLGTSKSLKALLRRMALRWIYKYISKAFFVGKNNCEYFRAAGLKNDELIFAPHAVDNDRFATQGVQQRAEIRTQLNLNDNNILVLFAGKFEAVKNPQLLIDAFTLLKDKSIHLLMVGNGPLEEPLKSNAKGNRCIHFMDFRNQSEVPAVYHACDLFCLPSESETWGLAVNEAMAAGKPVVVSNRVGCAPDLVTADNGMIFISGNAIDLSEKITFLCSDRELLKKKGSASAEIIKNWSFEKQAFIFEQELINESAPIQI